MSGFWGESGDLEYRGYEWERRMDVGGLQEVRWRGQGAQFFGVKGRRYKL